MAYDDIIRNIGQQQSSALDSIWGRGGSSTFTSPWDRQGGAYESPFGPFGQYVFEGPYRRGEPVPYENAFLNRPVPTPNPFALNKIIGGKATPGRTVAQALADLEARKANALAKGLPLPPMPATTIGNPYGFEAPDSLRPPSNAGPVIAGGNADIYNTGQPGVPPGSFTPGNRESFIVGMTPVAQAWEAKTGIPAEYFLAVNGSESNWGNAPGNMLFGIKNTAGNKGTGPLGTWEAGQGATQASFNAYGTPDEAYADFVKLVSGGRYAGAWNRFQQDKNADAFFQGLNQAGYATDPIWHQKIGASARSIKPTLTAPQARPQPAGGQTVDPSGKWHTTFDFAQTYTGDYRTGTPHRGVDLYPNQGGIGTSVEAFHPGVVSQISRDTGGAGGLMVWIRDDQGLTHTYMHLAGVANNPQTGQPLRPGDVVSRGMPIAFMGQSGTEGSPHLHYEVRRNLNGDPLNQLIDPRPYIRSS